MGQKDSKEQRDADRHSIVSKEVHCKPVPQRAVSNFLLVWLDTNTASSNKDSEKTLEQLRSVVNDISLFTDTDECVAFLRDAQTEKAFIITSGSLGQALVPSVHSMTHVNDIFIFCGEPHRHEQWVKAWPKIKGVHTKIAPICQALQLVVKQCHQDSTAMSFVPQRTDGVSNTNLDELDPSFMYTELFKNALLEMQHDKEAVQYLVRYCNDKYAENPVQLELIRKFGRRYTPEEAIWWYTREGFTYQMLNQALRLLEADILVNMGFFMHDLHKQIKQLHEAQIDEYGGKPFIVYRGQGMSTIDFDKLRKTQGGLMSFNSFLSTTTNRQTSLKFLQVATTDAGMAGLLFIMTIDPNVNSLPFANIRKASYYPTEEEILFSMHSVFRIDAVQSIGDENRLFEVQLTLTKDDDPQLRILTERFRDETEGSIGLDRIGRLLMRVGQLDKAEELYQTLLTQNPTETDVGHYYHQLGNIKNNQGEYSESVSFYEKAPDIQQKNLPANHPELATSYGNIGSVYNDMGEYSRALSFYEKALNIQQENFPENHPELATSYGNIGSVYNDMGEYSKALSFYEKALDIQQNNLPANHPSLATSYSNIGLVYKDMGEYTKALSYYEKALLVRQKTLPSNHPELATSYNNIGSVYNIMGEYPKAHSFYDKALDIRKKFSHKNHPELATSYSNIGSVYNDMGEYSRALSFYEKALNIQQENFPENHPELATSYNNIGLVYNDMGEYSKALSFYEKALDIEQKSLSANHPSLATSYNNIGSVYNDMGDYPKAISFYEKALDIREKALPASHPHLLSVRATVESLKKHLSKK